MPPNQTPQAINGPYMQSRVQYFGKTAFGSGGLGLLEWSGDGHIRLFAIDPASGQSRGVIFDCLPNQVKRAKVSFSVLTLKLPDKTYGMDLSSTALPWIATISLLGIFMAGRKARQSGIQWWVDNLKTQGVTVRQFNIGRWFLISFAGFFVLIVVIVLIAALAGGSK